MPLTEPTRLVLRKGWQPMDADAAAYISAVEAADTAAGQTGGLEEKTKIAIDNFVLGCKADGIWTAIKASCILAGARTLNGALVPLVGTAPTKYGTEGGWNYNRETGLKGNATNNYLDTNRNSNQDPQNSFHLSLYVAEGTPVFGNPVTFANDFLRGDNAVRARSSASQGTKAASAPFFIGANRADSNQFTARVDGTAFTYSRASVPGVNETLAVFIAYGNFSPAGRYTFYSIGESLDLALLDARVTDLINAFGAAIP